MPSVSPLPVYHIVHRLSLSIGVKICKEHVNDGISVVVEGVIAGYMGRDDDIVIAPKGIRLRKGLRLGHIKGSSVELSTVKGPKESIFIYCRAPAYIDKYGSSLHGLKLLMASQSLSVV